MLDFCFDANVGKTTYTIDSLTVESRDGTLNDVLLTAKMIETAVRDALDVDPRIIVNVGFTDERDVPFGIDDMMMRTKAENYDGGDPLFYLTGLFEVTGDYADELMETIEAGTNKYGDIIDHEVMEGFDEDVDTRGVPVATDRIWKTYPDIVGRPVEVADGCFMTLFSLGDHEYVGYWQIVDDDDYRKEWADAVSD